VILTPGTAEEFDTVDRHHGLQTWSWQIAAAGLGTVSFFVYGVVAVNEF